MTVKTLSKCTTLQEFSNFIQGDVDIKVGAAIGRKFKIGDKSYTLNQIWQQFEKCVQHDRKAQVSEMELVIYMSVGREMLQKLDERGNFELGRAIKNKTISPADANMIRIRQAIGNFFARFGGVHRKQSAERMDNLIKKIAGVTKKELTGKTKKEEENFILEKLQKKMLKSPEAFAKNMIDMLAKDEKSRFHKVLTAPRPVLELFFFQQNREALLKQMDPEVPVEEKVKNDPMDVADFQLCSLEVKLEKAGCEKLDLTHEGSITAEEFARLLATKEEIKRPIIPIPGTKNGYIARV